ncbi:F-box protein [Platanthera guangdongensis]|uniref:F-box protein n=1 Tax=Platanthera guangdongensis TaxID=2320717 RepID=A0ABR2MYW1_9ASPA
MKTETIKTETMKQRKETPHNVLHVREKATFNIPDDMIIEILLLLPARSVGRLRCVSKSWLSVSTTHLFVRAHAQRNSPRSLAIEWRDRNEFHFASADSNAGIALHNPTMKHRPKETIVEASWGGFLLLRNIITNQHSLFNPLTCHSINLPNNTCQFSVFLSLYVHRSTSKYRLIRLSADSPIKSEVLVVGESSWRHIPCFLPTVNQFPNPVEFNGRLHWLASAQSDVFTVAKALPTSTSLFKNRILLPDIIMTFDIETEEYNLLPLPPMKKTRNIGGSLVDFNGKLGLWIVRSDSLDVWVMDSSNWVKRQLVGGHRRSCPR